MTSSDFMNVCIQLHSLTGPGFLACAAWPVPNNIALHMPCMASFRGMFISGAPCAAQCALCRLLIHLLSVHVPQVLAAYQPERQARGAL